MIILLLRLLFLFLLSFYTPKEVAAILRFKRVDQVYAMCHSRIILSFQLGRNWLIPKGEARLVWRITDVGNRGEVRPLRQLANAHCHLSLQGEASSLSGS